MLMERKLVKAKDYLKENKKEIAVAVAGSCICAAGFALGWKLCLKSNGIKKGNHVIISDVINHWLDSVLHTYPDFHKIAWISGDDQFEVSKLGELGEVMKKYGASDDTTFTHFLAIGEPEKK